MQLTIVSPCLLPLAIFAYYDVLYRLLQHTSRLISINMTKRVV